MTDLTILGAGIFGLSIAWAAARRGARVAVIDPQGPCAGASGGVVGALAPHAPEQWTETKTFQRDALLLAEGWWQDVARAGGVDPMYARTGRLQPLTDEAAVARARTRAAAADDLWQGRATWAIRPAEEFADWLPPSPTGLVVHDTLSARIAPRAAIAALVAALAGCGISVAAKGPERGKVVHATGHAGLAGAPPLGTGVKGQAALLAFEARALPQIYADGLHIVPHGDGTVALGSTTEAGRSDTDVDHQLDAVIARARAICPALRDAPVVARWAGIRPRAVSRQPLMGLHPQAPGAFIANGGFKIGFGLAPLVGEVMADLLLDGRDSIPAAFRAPAG